MILKNIKFILLSCVVLFFTSVSLHAQDNNEDNSQVETVRKIGDVILFALPIASVGSSFIIGDEKGAWQFTKGLLLTTGITAGLKYSIDKQRPNMDNNNSFPSGHTSTVFHSAGYIHRRYGFIYSIPTYILAGYTGASRIVSKKHDIIDVIAGAAIGLGSNLLFTTEYQQKHLELSFNSNDGEYMLGFKYKF